MRRMLFFKDSYFSSWDKRLRQLLVICTLLFAVLIPQRFAVALSPPPQIIIINTGTNTLAFYENGNLVREFPVATGKSSTQTPQGKFLIVNKIKNRPYYTGGIPGGDPRNPLGDRWIGLNANGTNGDTYAIHGNNNESSIGKWVSGGCVRMHNADVRWLFDRVNVYTTVIIQKAPDSSYQDIAASYGISLAYEAPRGVMDTPASGATLSGSYDVSGWFLDESGIPTVEVLVDGVVVGQAVYGYYRPDVQSTHPEYNNAYAGYHYTLDTTGLSNGNHRITVRATGASGKVATLPERTVTVYNVTGYMDTPAPNTLIKGTHNVSGWFLDESGVAKVEVLVDGVVIGQAAYGDSRPDVQRVYPQYNNANSGYYYALDTTGLSEGNHSITVRATGMNGKVAALPERTITVSNVVGHIDYPAQDTAVKGTYNVSGWFLDQSGVAKLEVLVDGAVVGQAVYGDSRPDVKKVYPHHNNANAGYHYALDTTVLSEGSHTVTIRETGGNGKVTTLPERTLHVSNVVGYLDTPAPNAVLSGSYHVSGWFLDNSGVTKLEVLVDGAVVGQAVYGDSRPDVKRVYPHHNNANAGYHYTLDTKSLTDGKHTITIRETGANGKITTLPERTVTISNVEGYVDYPVKNEVIGGSYTVSGWFLDQNGVAKVEVLVDGAVVGQAVYGDSRQDVKNVYPHHNNANAGYHYALDTTKLAEGSHTIAIRETGVTGKVTTLPARTVTVSNVEGYLDNPAPNVVVTGKYKVSGWFLDRSGVAKLEVLVDGAVVGQAVYGDSRPDVKNVYPHHNNANAGYHYMLDTTKLSEGTHTITIRETGVNGKVTALPERTITVSNVEGYLDNPAPDAVLSGTYHVSGWFLDQNGVSKVEVLVDGAVVGQAVYGDSRPDVRNVYPHYNNANSGYHYALDTTKLAEGSHTITVRETGATGKVTMLSERKVMVVNVK